MSVSKGALVCLDKGDRAFHPEGIDGVCHDSFERDVFKVKTESSDFKGIGFVTVHTVDKGEKQYPVFLVVATKQ